MKHSPGRLRQGNRGTCRRWQLLLMILVCISFVPAQAFSEDRVERIEQGLNALEQKLEGLIKENASLRERMKSVSASEQEARAMIEELRKASELLKASAARADGEKGEEAEQSASIGTLKQENAKIKDRLDEIEVHNEESAIKIANLVDVSGYSDVEYYFSDEPGQNSRFRVRHFSLFFSKSIQDAWDLFSEIEFEDAPFIEANQADPLNNTTATVQGKFLVEQMYIKYHPQVDWDIVAGRFLTPAGIWSVYHYPPYVPTQARPLMVRNIFPQFSDGLALRNSFNIGDALLDTHLYIANGAGNPARLDRNSSKAVGAKLNLLSDLFVEAQLGASYYREKDNLNATRSSYGLHMMLDYEQLGFQSEFAIRKNSPLNLPFYYDTSLYAQLTFDINDWTLAARYDWYNTNSITTFSDNYRYTGALNYHFDHNVLGKVEYNRNTFDDPTRMSFHELVMAITVAIGDF